MRYRTCFLLLALLALATPARGADDLRDADARTWKRIKKVLPHQLWLEGRAKRTKVDEAWKKLGDGRVRLTRKQLADLGTILRAGSPFTTEKRWQQTLRIATGKGDEKLPVRIVVTPKYKPGCGRSFPLVITTHGGPMQDERSAEKAAGTQFGMWRGYAATVDCIVAAPALPGSTFAKREWTFLENLVRDIDRIYNVDRDRVLLTGHSWGGILTWHLGPPHADTFCLLAPFVCAINPGKTHLENLRALPVYHVQGRKDHRWMVETGRERKKILDDLGYEHVYREKPGGHMAFTGEVAKIAKLFVTKPRRIYARQIVRTKTRAGRNESDLWYWLRSRDHDLKATIDAKTRTVDVDVHGAFEVFLADEMLDLDGPITIRRRGEEVWKGTVERRLDFAIEHVRETGDRGRVFGASVKVR